MKASRKQVQKKAHALPKLKFENQQLTSFAGLVIVQKFFASIKLKEKLRGCFRRFNGGAVYSRATVFLQLILHLLLGFRELRDARYYQCPLNCKRLPIERLVGCIVRGTAFRSGGGGGREDIRRRQRPTSCTFAQSW